MKRKYFSIAATAILLSAFVVGCHPSHDPEHDHESRAAEEQEHGDEIHLCAERAAAAGVRVEPAPLVTLRSVVKATGRIESAPDDQLTLSAPVAGSVALERGLAPGTPLAPGSPLLTLSPRGAADGDALARRRIELETARKELERVRSLAADAIVSQRDLEQAEQRYATARADYEAMGAPADASRNGFLSVAAPFAGYLQEILVKNGESVQAGAPLVTLAAGNRLRLRAELPQRYARRAAEFTSANFAVEQGTLFNTDSLRGRLAAAARSLTGAGGYLPLSFDIDGDAALLPGSYARVWLLGTPREGVLALPLAALTEEQGCYFVYLQVDEEGYRKQPVTIGASDGERVEILSGLQAGDPVVVAGAMQVRLASMSGTIPGHSHNH